MVNNVKKILFLVCFVGTLSVSAQHAHAASPYDLETNQGDVIPYSNTAVTSTPAVEGYQDTSSAEAVPIINTGPVEESIIGSDNRNRVSNTSIYPHSASVYITATFSNGKTYSGSGAMISPDTVLTAGHVIFNNNLKQWATIVTVYPGVNGNSAPFGKATATRLASVTGWTKNADSKYDIGMVRLTRPLGTNTGWFGLTSGASIGQTVTSTGYPGDKPRQSMWTMSGKISSLNNENVYYPLDTFGGQSGSPVFNSSRQILAVHAYGATTVNYGTRISSSIYNWISGDLNKIKSIFRLYNPNSGEHFYTDNGTEVNSLKRAGWKDEGLGWFAPSSGSNVYRLYNPNAGDHHYTMNNNEKNNLVKVGWKYEGISWFSDNSKRKPLYRLYNPNAKKAGTHHYTPHEWERENLKKAGWRDEGVGWWGL
ncbi:trypsin-like peptidase domain-containing protein [Enterococcus gilvus]|uniref:trypsin-like peptidase domain-containing protein n=1 Tax=Enterococcus gilvus TaxID=160453 RepID=UPI0028E55CBD|nr:trypsin-like peptidase domain-containing protein [Carnobacterium maltaromaticum]